jgi:hypothetical protein
MSQLVEQLTAADKKPYINEFFVDVCTIIIIVIKRNSQNLRARFCKQLTKSVITQLKALLMIECLYH